MLNFQIFVSQISGPGIMFASVLVLAVALYIEKYTKDFYTIFFTSTTAMFITYTLKYTLKIPRPDTMLVAATDYRFPSGHATMAAVVMSLGIHYAHIHVKSKYLRYLLYTFAIAWYLLISYSRLYLGVHYPIDVIAGGIIGSLSAYITLKIFKHLHYYK